jgi:predicted kinase
MSMRAAIRAKVTAARLENATGGGALATAATTYFNTAKALIAPEPPVLVAIGGFSGTGKSVLARALAPGLSPAPGAIVLRSDVERKALFGAAETDRLPAEAYAAEATAKTYAALADKARRVTAAGHSAIVDAVLAEPGERAAIADAAKAGGVAFHGLFLTADLAARLARVGARTADASDADAAVARRQESYALGPLDWIAIDASGTPAQSLARAEKTLR